MAESPGRIPPDCPDDAARSRQRGEPRKLGLILLLALFLGLGTIAITLGIPAHRRWQALKALEEHGAKVTLTQESEWMTQQLGDWAIGFRGVTRIEVRDLSDEVCIHISILQETTELDSRSYWSSEPLTIRGMRALHSLGQLEHFTAWGTGFSDELLAELFSSAPPLRGVTLHGTGIGQRGIEALVQSPSIEYINILNWDWAFPCLLRDEDFLNLPALPQLQHLNLANCPVDECCMEWATQSPELKKLILDGTAVSDAGLRQLCGLSQLEQLDISDCQNVTEVALESLVLLPNLRELRLSPDLVTEQTLELLKQSTSLREVHAGSLRQAMTEVVRTVHFPSMEVEHSFPPIDTSRIDMMFSLPGSAIEGFNQSGILSQDELQRLFQPVP